MKSRFFIFFILLLPFIFSQEINYFVNDYTNTLSKDEIYKIETTLKKIYDSGKAEYSIVLIDTLNGEDNEGYSYKLAEGKLGDKEKNNGLLLLIALKDRQYRFEVGRGLEPELPDIIVSRIGRYYLEPNFKNENYAIGISEASEAIKMILLNGTQPEQLKDESAENRAWVIFAIVWIIAVLIIMAAVKNSHPVKRIKQDEYFTAAWVLSQMLKGGKGGGKFGSGGFGGFGGGSFGGGGAGGRW